MAGPTPCSTARQRWYSAAGVLAARDAALLAEIEYRYAAAAPRAVFRVASAPPVLGAALLGLDWAGAADGAEQRLRAAFAHRPAVPPAAGLAALG